MATGTAGKLIIKITRPVISPCSMGKADVKRTTTVTKCKLEIWKVEDERVVLLKVHDQCHSV